MIQAGIVQSIIGKATALNASGQTRELLIGDFIYENELVETTYGAKVTLLFTGGVVADLGENDQLFVDKSVVEILKARDTVVEEVAALQQAVADAIADGEDPSQLMEAPAAGNATNSHDFNSGYHAGDTSKGNVDTYLLDSTSDSAQFAFQPSIGDAPDEKADTDTVVTLQSSENTEDDVLPLVDEEGPAGNPLPPTGTTINFPPPVLVIEDEDSALTPADNSVVEGTGNTVVGDMRVTASAGIGSVTVGGLISPMPRRRRCRSSPL